MPWGVEVSGAFCHSLAERLTSDWPQDSAACVCARVWDCDGGGAGYLIPGTWLLLRNMHFLLVSFGFWLWLWGREEVLYSIIYPLRNIFETSGLHDGSGSAVDSQWAASRRLTMGWEEILGGRELLLRFRTPTVWIWCHEWRRKRQPTPVFLTRESHEQRSLAGCSPCGRKELDITERVPLTWCYETLVTSFFKERLRYWHSLTCKNFAGIHENKCERTLTFRGP